MAFLYDHTVEELTASTWKKVVIGVLLTLIFHLGDALLGGHLAKTYKINASEIGKVNHLPFCFYKMAKPSLRLSFAICHWQANGKTLHSPRANDRQMRCVCQFAEANWQMANDGRMRCLAIGLPMANGECKDYCSIRI